LRVLQEGTFERIGESRPRRADVRIVAATNRDLPREVAEGRFRQDLYYRLNVFPVETPALRERRGDIADLAAHLILEICRRMNRPPLALAPTELSELEQYEWPGNVRELRNVLERAVITTPSPATHVLLPPLRAPQGSRTRADLSAPAAGGKTVVSEADVKRFEKDNLLAALERAGGRIYGPGGAADLLGVKPTTLASRLKKLRIAPGA